MCCLNRTLAHVPDKLIVKRPVAMLRYLPPSHGLGGRSVPHRRCLLSPSSFQAAYTRSTFSANSAMKPKKNRAKLQAHTPDVSFTASAVGSAAVQSCDTDMADAAVGQADAATSLQGLETGDMHPVLDSSAFSKLSSIFGFKHIAPAHHQSHPDWYLESFSSFVQCLMQQTDSSEGAEVWHNLPQSHVDCLTHVAEVLKGEVPTAIEWLPRFGCALLPLPAPSTGAVHQDQLALYLVAPDEWQFNMHGEPTGTHHTAQPTATTTLWAGMVHDTSYPAFLQALRRIIADQEKRKHKKSKEEGANRHSFFQYTPAFILTAIKSALEELEDSNPEQDADQEPESHHETHRRLAPPRGGFTDVGVHTGGIKRDTSWPLVRQMIWAVLHLTTPGIAAGSPQQKNRIELNRLISQAMMYFELWLMQQVLQQLSPAAAVPAFIDACMVMLQSVAGKAADLAVQGADVFLVEAACLQVRRQLDDVMGQRQLQAAEGFTLPAEAAAAGTWRLPRGIVPAELPVATQLQGLEAALARAAANLGSVQYVPAELPFKARLKQLLVLLESGNKTEEAAGADVALQHSLRSAEQALFTTAAEGFSGPALSHDEVELLAEVIDSYRMVMLKLQGSLQDVPGAASHSQLRSREVLIGWVGYCLMHQAAAAAHPQVAQYGALDYVNLRHLALSDKLAVDAALAVSNYLKQHSIPGCSLFDLSQQGATFSFAEEFATADYNLSQILDQQQSAAAARVNAHWQQVQQQQREAALLRPEIASLEAKAARLRNERSNLPSYSWPSRYDSLTREISAAESTLSQKRYQLSSAEHPPESVIQPLPRFASLARQWLFFLHMPPLLRQLARASCLAQQLLLPRALTEEVCQQLAVTDLQTSLPTHYNNYQAVYTYHQPAQLHDGSDGGAGRVMLRSFSQVPRQVGPGHIDSYYGREDGVWWPDSMAATMAWQGSYCPADVIPPGFFNPFHPVSNSIVVESFTDTLPEEYSHLQWAVYQYGSMAATATDRGNRGIASQEDRARSSFLDKPAYLAFTALRAFPLRQLHQLCCILREKELPLGHPAVQVLVRQTVYQLGELVPHSSNKNSSQVVQLWRMQWDKPGGVLHALHHELQQLAEELANKPREQDSVLLLGELAAYLSDWHPPCSAVARQFAAMTMRHADEQLQQEIDKHLLTGPDELVLAELKAKQSRWRAMALLCFVAGPLDTEAISHMIRLMLLIKHGDVYQPDPSAAAELAALRVRCHDVMARRLPSIIQALDQQPQLLTTAAAAVLERLQQQPEGLPVPVLPWQRLGQGSSPLASYQAIGSDGHLYSINVLDGTVLFDGKPPGRLPKSILQHRLYTRTFGRTNHEVVETDDGQLQTIRPIQGRFYRFYLMETPSALPTSEQPDLVIIEGDPTQAAFGSLELQLLDVGPNGDCASWGEELPVRLRQLCSHWLNREHGVIVLRPPEFQHHKPSFLIRSDLHQPAPPDPSHHSRGIRSTSSTSHYACWRVPTHLQSKHWTELLGSYTDQLSPHQLVLSDCQSSQVLHVLSKFEQADFIHVYVPGHCPRLLPRSSVGALSSNRSSQSLLPSQGSAVVGMTWHLPRFGMVFGLSADYVVLSRNYQGYQLSTQQLLTRTNSAAAAGVAAVANTAAAASATSVHYTLPEFHQYLVLRAQASSSLELAGAGRSETLVLVPTGQVTVDRQAPGSTWTTASVKLQVDPGCNAALKAFAYEVHGRFGHLRAPSLHARLQLAALYAATSTLLPEPGSQLTGAQTAMQLVRQSWTNEPLSQAELSQLRSISSLGGFLAPGLRLLTYDVEASTCQLQHLHVAETGAGAARRHANTGPTDGNTAAEAVPGTVTDSMLNTDAGSEYLLQANAHVPAGFRPNPRQQLTAEEEGWVLHTGPGALHHTSHVRPQWQRQAHYTPVGELPDFPVASDYVSQAEQQLLDVLEAPRKPQQLPDFPLPQLSSTVPLAGDMLRELEHSWQCYHSNPEPSSIKPGAREVVEQLQVQVSSKRQAAEAYLLKHLDHIPDDVGEPGIAFRLLQSSASQPTAAPLDLLALAWGSLDRLTSFNPFLTEAACVSIREGVLLWLQLCVLEDRLACLMRLMQAGDNFTPLVIRELLTHRVWDAQQHPQWLVFEVEGQLQIRPAQYVLAAQLLAGLGADGKGPIAQLNMGEGKTRVILPMLALELADGSNLVRVNFLAQLLHEGKLHLQQHITASVLGRKVFYMPFHRGVNVTAASVRAMAASLQYCQKVGGVLVMAPEHRNSLLLKQLELFLAGEADGVSSQLSKAVKGLLDYFPYFDIVDESDEIFHHNRRQLVYAWGDSSSLPAFSQRVEVVQALLLLLSRLADQGDAQLNAQGVTRKTSRDDDRKPGSFCGMCLLSGDQLDAALPGINKLLAEQLLQDPPMEDELGWLNKYPNKELLLKLMIDSNTCANSLLARAPLARLSPDKQHQLLTCRGMLACGLLSHCLQMRHRVNYGVDRRLSARKRLAVPYRAADLPSERSEFSQPDVALVYTHIAYYGDGLSTAEFKAAVEELLSKGDSEQGHHYNRWLAQGQGLGANGPAGPMAAFDSVDKIDPNNSQLMRSMWKFFSHNMEVVNYWLLNCVLPLETRQYPSRLVATAWNLAHNPTGNIVGFSGTNDSHRLLPGQVKQVTLDDAPELEGTNGKMLHMLLQHATYSTLQLDAGTHISASKAGVTAPTLVWQLLLQEALHQDVDAIIDCGALLAGASLRAAADFLLKHMSPGRYRGVCYFSAQHNSWVILDTFGSISRKNESNLRESEAFVIFDDARCRGADLKLKQQAVALLTLDPRVPKDKLMQAAGRLRQLGRGQTLLVTGLPDVSGKIQAVQAATAATAATAAASARGGSVSRKHPASHEPDIRAVLAWVMYNTVESTLAGVAETANQGMQFAATHISSPELSVWPEKLAVGELYGSKKAVEPLHLLLASLADKYILHVRAGASSSGSTSKAKAIQVQHEAISNEVKLIEQRFSQLGKGHKVTTGQGADEECERELEQEEEMEEEEERQVPAAIPAHERDWLWSQAFVAASPAELGCEPLQLPGMVKLLSPSSDLAGIAWSTKVWVTHNFVHGISHGHVQTAAAQDLSQYMRPVNALLLFSNSGDVLLLSEREADAVQKELWTAYRDGSSSSSGMAARAPPNILLTLSYLRLAFQDPNQHYSSSSASNKQQRPMLLLADELLAGSDERPTGPMQLAVQVHQRVQVPALVSTQLFNGCVMYNSAPERALLGQLMSGRKEAAQELVDWRGRLHLLPRSDLERACTDNSC